MLASALPHWKNIYEAGCAAYKNNDHQRAEALFTEAIALKPTVGLYDCRAATREKLGDLSGASQDAKKMLQIEPCSAKSYLRAGKILRMSGKFHSVVQLYMLGKTKVPETDPNYSILLKILVQAETALEKRTKAESPIGIKSAVCRDMVAFLPAELVHTIIHHLDFATIWRCTRVCKSWRCFLESSPYLWSQAIFTPASKKGISNLTLHVLIRRAGRQLKELDLGHASRLTDAGFRKLQCSPCMRVERLELLRNSKVSGMALACWARVGGTHLRRLCLSDTAAANDVCVSIILNNCRGLVSLDISWCPVTDRAFHELDVDPQYLLERKRVILSLEEIILDYCNVSLKAVRYLSESSPKLSKLSLRNAYRVTRDCLTILHYATSPLQLRELTLTGTMMAVGTVPFDTLFTLFARGMPSLERFELASCSELTDSSMMHLAEYSGPRLTTIDISSSARITDVTPLSLGSRCPNLTRVSLAGCPLLTDPSLQFLIRKCPLVEKFDLAGCPGVSDATCAAMAEWSDRLEELNVSRCAVSGVGIGKLVRGAGKGLRVLSMDHCPRLSPDVANWARQNLAPGAKVSALMEHVK